MIDLTMIESVAFYENVITISVGGVEIGHVTEFSPSQPNFGNARMVQFNTIRGDHYYGVMFERSRSAFDEEVEEIARAFEYSLMTLKI